MKSKTPTAHERERMRLIKELGCIVCGSAPCEVHHLLSGGKRRGHRFTVGLCQFHHTGAPDTPLKDNRSYHGNKKLFQSLYYYDQEMLDRQDDLLIANGFEP